MIKGINKQTVFLRLDGNSVYEGAYFILKNEAKQKNEADKDMLAEANRIIAEHNGVRRKRSGKDRLLRFFSACLFLFVGAFVGFFLSMLLF